MANIPKRPAENLGPENKLTLIFGISEHVSIKSFRPLIPDKPVGKHVADGM